MYTLLGFVYFASNYRSGEDYFDKTEAGKGMQDHYSHISDSGNYRSTSSRNGQGSLWSFNAVSDDCGKGNCDLQNEINHVFQEGLCQSI